MLLPEGVAWWSWLAMSKSDGIIIGIDAGTSVLKAVAFELSGRQIASASARNRYETGDDGSVTQSLGQTWSDCLSALRGLGEKVGNLAARTAAIAVTGQGDGTACRLRQCSGR